MTLTFGSLFSGIGGIDLGLERAGMECRWQVEIEPYCQRVLHKHWPNVPKWDDVCTFPPPEGKWDVDLIAGGFPCQDISFAGKGAGLNGERSGLFYEFARIIRVMEPRYVLMENVSALLVRGIDDVLGTLASLGYDAEWHCIPAAVVGAPQRRDRVFIIAHADSGRFAWKQKRDCYRTVCEQWNYTDGLELAARRAKDAVSVLRRMANGIPSSVHRLRGLGNAVVPQVAEWIGKQIVECDLNTR